MKTKNKTIAMVEIAVVLFSVFLVALPVMAIAAEQTTQKASASGVTTASEDDYVLGVYGNANEDDTIDMGDVVYVKLAIFGKKPKTELCDAKYDGRINVLDVIQTKLIILGKEKEITVLQHLGYPPNVIKEPATITKPVQRIAVFLPGQLEVLRSLGVEDRVVGIAKDKIFDPAFFPEIEDLPSYGWKHSADIEAILNTNPDFAMIDTDDRSDNVAEGLKVVNPEINRLRIKCTDWQYGTYKHDVIILGYVFDKQDEAEELLEFYDGYKDMLQERADTLSEDDKPLVFIMHGDFYGYRNRTEMIELVGGRDMTKGMPGGRGAKIDPEFLLEQKPDVIIRLKWRAGASGYGILISENADLVECRDEVLNEEIFARLNAVQSGHVYIDSNDLSVAYCGPNGARTLILELYMAKSINPTLFADLDPRAVHQEYITRFQGLDIDLDKQGVFWYPEPS